MKAPRSCFPERSVPGARANNQPCLIGRNDEQARTIVFPIEVESMCAGFEPGRLCGSLTK